MNTHRLACLAVAAVLTTAAGYKAAKIVTAPVPQSARCCLTPDGPCLPSWLDWACSEPKPQPCPKPRVEPRGPAPYASARKNER